MVHACACCRLRFATNAELADHVHDEHTEHEPFSEGHLSVLKYRHPRATAPTQEPTAPTR